MSVEKGKKYRTRSGFDVTIYAAGLPNTVHCVHGAVLQDGAWLMECWTCDGRYSTLPGVEAAFDLIEVKPRIKREVWVNVYRPEDVSLGSWYSRKEDADAGAVSHKRLACVKLTIDCEEGEGL